jgi:ribosomal protein S6
MNRNYELMFIVRPDMVDEDLNKLISTLESSVTSAGGTAKSEVWGKRRLAYKVGKFNDGIFVLMLIEATGAVVTKSNAAARDRTGDQVPHRAHGRRTEAARQDQEAARREEESQRAAGRRRARSSYASGAGSGQPKHRLRHRFSVSGVSP